MFVTTVMTKEKDSMLVLKSHSPKCLIKKTEKPRQIQKVCPTNTRSVKKKWQVEDVGNRRHNLIEKKNHNEYLHNK